MFKTFFNLFTLMAIYIATKPKVHPDEQNAVTSACLFLQDPSLAPAFDDLKAEGYIDEKGHLTKYGIATAVKLGQKPRNARQLNFKRLLESATPGYTIGLMLTAETRFNELCEAGIMKYADLQLANSLMDASARLEHWAARLESNKLNSDVGEGQISPVEVLPTDSEGEE